MATTIPIDAKVRDRLRGFGLSGQTYNDILTALMDRVELDEFVRDARRRIAEADREGTWIDLEDLDEAA